jgi:hypothetical protein
LKSIVKRRETAAKVKKAISEALIPRTIIALPKVTACHLRRPPYGPRLASGLPVYPGEAQKKPIIEEN